MVSLRIGDTSKVTAYYERAYREFQQLNCRAIAKEFIRAIEPLKQVKHPYNGKTPVGSASGTERNPEATKPNWWPPGVMHKEPDHLKKEYRLQLLVHITCKLGSHGITIDMLKQVARGIERKLPDPQRAEVIYEILRVRNMQEKFEKGQVDENVIVKVYPFKGKEDKPINTVNPSTEEPHHHDEQGPMAVKPIKPKFPLLNTLAEAQSSAPTHYLPRSLSGYNMWSQCSNLSSQPMFSTTAETIGANYNSIPDCPIGNPFAASHNFDRYTKSPHPHDSNSYDMAHPHYCTHMDSMEGTSSFIGN